MTKRELELEVERLKVLAGTQRQLLEMAIDWRNKSASFGASTHSKIKEHLNEPV